MVNPEQFSFASSDANSIEISIECLFKVGHLSAHSDTTESYRTGIYDKRLFTFLSQLNITCSNK